ncbi:MAG: Asp-tRNA(Asn)/Glu-tRNA(Gln) amidotransferase subunit GatA [Acidobacteriota bacterium]|nr:MAG: Asp-tRNA(Asn)/Glu-tRNA(Gln) amidotransferase subunit GatA [Acidobacteriota bacterium]
MNAAPPTAARIATAVTRSECSAEQVVNEALARLDASAGLNAVLHRNDARALERARGLDERRARGEPLGALAGVPVAIKDNICTRELPTTCASKLLAGYRPPYDATAVAKLERAGAVVIAKTNCDEFGMGSSNENSAFGPVLHPLDPERTPGGSSGGSAALVAHGAVPAALGSDTGGSVRQPAAFCGIVGLKPTYGRVSRWGLVAFGSSLDQIGTLTRSVEDAALMLAVIAGFDARDATSAEEPVEDYRGQLAQGTHGVRIGSLSDFVEADGVEPEVSLAVESAVHALREAGTAVQDVSLPLARETIPIYYLIATAEASSNLARFDGVRFGARAGGVASLQELYERTRGGGFGAEVKRRIMLGTYALSAGYYDAYFARAQRARALLQSELDVLFEKVDLLLCPTAPQSAFLLGERIDDPLAMYLSDVFTVLANLGGQPAISVPAPARPGALPVGVQLIARRFDEALLLRTAAVLERAGFRNESAS